MASSIWQQNKTLEQGVNVEEELNTLPAASDVHESLSSSKALTPHWLRQQQPLSITASDPMR